MAQFSADGKQASPNDKVKAYGPLAVTVIIFVLVAWWLFLVAGKISTPPTVNDKGAVVLDEFQRAKDILLVLIPLATAAAAYWLGSAGKAKAEEQAAKSQSQLTAVVSEAADSSLLEKAKQKYPDAFR